MIILAHAGLLATIGLAICWLPLFALWEWLDNLLARRQDRRERERYEASWQGREDAKWWADRKAQFKQQSVK
jgi:hypothetical protein